jgi:uncharacterized membrane protein YidH (DUF202 family)
VSIPSASPPASQAERTGLAWSRTVITTGALVAFLGIHAAMNNAPDGAVLVVLIVAGLLLVSSSVIGTRASQRASRALGGGARAPRPGAYAAMTAAAVLLSLVALVTAVVAGRG